jgi:hypothetical protein
MGEANLLIVQLNRSMPIYAPYPTEARVLNLQGEDSVSSNAGPVTAGAAVLGNLADRSGVGDGASCLAAWLAWRYHDSAESNRQDNPQTPVW